MALDFESTLTTSMIAMTSNFISIGELSRQSGVSDLAYDAAFAR